MNSNGQNNFWKKLTKPFTALAPMEDVTDYAFRQILAETAPPDVFFTEFTSVEGLCSEGFENVSHRLKYNESQRPIVAQIWGITPQKFKEAANIINELGFDGIDINMGCPHKKVVKIGAGAGLIKNRILTQEIISATKEGAGTIPVSVKTRTGFERPITESWTEFLLKQNIAALSMHGRTKKQLSKVPADWNEIAKVVKTKEKINAQTVVVGNGDVTSFCEVKDKANKYDVDGVMIGRGVLIDPWVFEKKVKPKIRRPQEKIKMLLKHTKLFEEFWGHKKNFAIMKKFFKTYIRDFDGASELRANLMECENYDQALDLANGFMKSQDHQL